MEIKDFAPKFKISMNLKDVQLEADLRLQLQRLGFQITPLTLEKIDCHLLILDTQALTESLSHFFETVLRQNPDLRIILIGKSHQYQVLAEYKKYNAEVVIDQQDHFLRDKILWEIEKSCRSLYYFYQNEQLLSDYLQVKTQLDKSLQLVNSHPDFQPQSNPDPTVERDRLLLSLLRELNKIDDFVATVTHFLNHAPHQRKMFFSFDPSEMSFRANMALGFELSIVKDLKYNSNESELRNLIGLKFSIVPEGLERFLVQIFQSPHYVLHPLVFMGNIIGFYVFQGSSEGPGVEAEQAYMDVMGQAIHVHLEFLWARRRIIELEVRDSKTQFFNAKYYRSKSREEFQRCQRMQHPLSMLKFTIDDYFELQQSLGKQVFDDKLMQFSQVVVQTGRPHDTPCRLSDTEFVILLPYCTRKNAAIRAERLRKAVEAHETLKNVFKPTLSFGVSEYPSLCNNIDDLDLTATKAMKYIQERGGNKVCIYRAPQNFSPAFEVSAE